jgi:prolyl-tRNA synthetase
MRWSKYLLNTLKEDPSDAEIISHKLMLRAGMIRKVAAGIYNYLPLCHRTIRKVETIVREEMDKIALEILMPILSPADLWHESGRWSVYGKELMRFKDRKEADYALGPTHEEVVTDIANREIKSYRQLPICLYQIQDKFRDEVRPRFGVMRGREFIMKDAYSFHRNFDDLDLYYKAMHGAYTRIFKRCGLQFRPVVADPGAIGGNETHEFMVLAESGESGIIWCQDLNCGFAATDEAASAIISVVKFDDNKELDLELLETPNCKTIKDVSAFLGVSEEICIKAMIYRTENEIILALIRGDRQLNEAKLQSLVGGIEVELVVDDTTYKDVGLVPGYAGPINVKSNLRIIADESIRRHKNMVIGANKSGFHFRNANWDRDIIHPEYADITLAEEGDPCPSCGKPLRFSRGIEAGQIFKLGKKYSESMSASFVDEDGRDKPFVMGCYGIGITRTIAAAIEQNNDDKGIIWPVSLAPYTVLLTSLGATKQPVSEFADRLYEDLLSAGFEVLYDDRKLGAGFKLKDADLIGIPLRIVIGERGIKEGFAEVKLRKSEQVMKIPIEEVIDTVSMLLDKLWIEMGDHSSDPMNSISH